MYAGCQPHILRPTYQISGSPLSPITSNQISNPQEGTAQDGDLRQLLFLPTHLNAEDLFVFINLILALPSFAAFGRNIPHPNTLLRYENFR